MKQNKIKQAIITGASKGIGKAIAIELAKDNVEVILFGRNKKKLESVVQNIRQLGSKASFYETDVSDATSYSNTLDIVKEKYNNINILINNAGINKDKLILRMDENSWDSVINTNLKGTYLAIQKISKNMIRNRWGRIVNITSISGQTGAIGQSNYSASKAGIIGLSKSVAKELASRNITVNCISPGFINTDMTKSLDDKIKEKYLESIPLNRFGKPHEVAKLVRFICSNEADYITGQTINIDGGIIM